MKIAFVLIVTAALAAAAWLAWSLFSNDTIETVATGQGSVSVTEARPEAESKPAVSATLTAAEMALPLPGADHEGPVVIESEANFEVFISQLMMNNEAALRAWFQSRGVPREDPNGNFMLEQPYQQYDDETLTALARNGDMWAQQILAERIKEQRPAEAMELYRQSAAAGSLYAMIRLADLSGQIAGLSQDYEFEDKSNKALDQYYSLRDGPVSPVVSAYAWRAIAEMAGMPPYISMAGGGLSGDDLASACQLASSIYDDLLSQRASRGLGSYPNDPPTMWFDVGIIGGNSGCEHDRAVSYDFSPCKEYQVKTPETGEVVSFYICNES